MIRKLLTAVCSASVLACSDAPTTLSETLPPVDSAAVILEGTVRRFTTDQLMGGVAVLADNERVTSSGRGAYVFTALGEGEVQIRATYPGFHPYSAKQRLRPGRNVHDIELVPEG